MQELSMKTLLERYNLIVPEIQREYVWGKNEYSIVDFFIKDMKNGYQSHSLTSSKEILDSLRELGLNEVAIAAAIAAQSNNEKGINIGFIYSYKPDYYTYTDDAFDVFLIDGQQRITTMFLFLFYFAIKEKRLPEFIQTFKFNAKTDKIAFDYRVRNLTHKFLIELLDQIKTIEDLRNIKKKSWFLKNYIEDITIKSIVGSDKKNDIVIGIFPKLFNEFENDDTLYYDYLLTQIKFWHFKTEETSEGEELYITMNSRGQQLSDNENLRAKLFATGIAIREPLYWSEQWEKWQDFFWKHRDRQNNADYGLDEFFRWVTILSLFAKDKEIRKYVRSTKNGLDENVLSLEYIQKCFTSLEYLYDDSTFSLIKDNYNLYKNFSLLDRKWLAANNNAGIEQIDLFRLLPVIYFCNLYFEKHSKLPDPLLVFRVLRFFYNLKDNPTISKGSAEQLVPALKIILHLMKNNDDIIDVLNLTDEFRSILTNEELLKLDIYKNGNRANWEDILWYAESIPSNKGRIYQILNKAKNRDILKSEDFSKFQKLVFSYEHVIKNEHNIWGNLLTTDVYTFSYDRVTHDSYWFRKNGIMNLSEKIYDTNVDNLNSIIIEEQKSFLRTFNSFDEIYNEIDPKKQLYILYLVQSIVLKNWNWQGSNYWNFGIDGNFNGTWKSLFLNGNVYQFFNQKYTWNFDKIGAITAQTIKDPVKQKDLINTLLSWSKK